MALDKEDWENFRLQISRDHATMTAELRFLKETVSRIEENLTRHDSWEKANELRIETDLKELREQSVKVRAQAGMIAFIVGTFGVTLVELLFRR